LTLYSEYPRIKARIKEGEAKRNKRENLKSLLQKKINSLRYPMQEFELNYPTTKGKVYSEEEDHYLLCRLYHYGMQVDHVYECIKKDISEFPVFCFDWFLKSRSPQELQRRCNTLLWMIEKEELHQSEEARLMYFVVWDSTINKVEDLKATQKHVYSAVQSVGFNSRHHVHWPVCAFRTRYLSVLPHRVV
jgi:hypothetical protein